MDFSEEHKNQVGVMLTHQVGHALNEGKLTQEQVPEVCGYILDRIDLCKTQAEIVSFLEELVQKWSFFDTILALEKNKAVAAHDEQKVAQVTKLIEENKLDEAVLVAQAKPKTTQ